MDGADVQLFGIDPGQENIAERAPSQLRLLRSFPEVIADKSGFFIVAPLKICRLFGGFAVSNCK